MAPRSVGQNDVERWILDRSAAGGDGIDPAVDLVDGGYIDEFSLVELVFVLGALGDRRVDIQALEPGGLRRLSELSGAFLATAGGVGQKGPQA